MKKIQKTFILLSFVLLAFTLGDGKSEYIIPYRAFSITTTNINLDENCEIIIGNFTSWQETNPTITILKNDGFGYFSIIDTSLTFCGYQKNIFAIKINQDEYPDIVAFSSNFSSGEPERFIRILYNEYGIFNEFSDFSLNSSSTFTSINYGDVNGDNFNDILVIINNDFKWGIIYNDGTGNFSAPEYFDLDFPPVDIACADLNDDGRADVVLCGTTTEIYFSTETGFQQQILTTTLSADILISDFDNDGDNDILTHTTFINPKHRVFMFENLGNNQFYEHPYFEFSPFCSYAQTADFNNDSLPDMVFTGFDDEGLYIYNNIGNFQIEFDQFIQIDNDALLQKLTCADFDYNNYSDIALIKGYWGTAPSVLQIYFNNGIGGFQQNPVTKIIEKANDNNYFECFPNPMKYKTNFKINIKKTAQVELAIYNLQGKPVINLINNKLEGGIYNTKWDGVDNSNHTCNPGPYFAYLAVNGKIHQIIKLLII